MKIIITFSYRIFCAHCTNSHSPEYFCMLSLISIENVNMPQPDIISQVHVYRKGASLIKFVELTRGRVGRKFNIKKVFSSQTLTFDLFIQVHEKSSMLTLKLYWHRQSDEGVSEVNQFLRKLEKNLEEPFWHKFSQIQILGRADNAFFK